ncbi:unnamed protein product, partial [Vitis vinifera]
MFFFLRKSLTYIFCFCFGKRERERGEQSGERPGEPHREALWLEGLGYSSNGLLILRRLLLFLILLFCVALSVSQDPGDSAEIKEIWGSGFEFFLYWVLFFKYLSIYAIGCWLRGAGNLVWLLPRATAAVNHRPKPLIVTKLKA